MNQEQESGGEDSTANLSQDATMTELLMFFLKEQKKIILRKKQDITVAIYEYMFAHRGEQDALEVVRSQFDTGTMILAKIIQEGAERGEFYCTNAKAEANNIMYALEGMKICAKTLGLSERKVDEELLYLVSGLVMEEE